MLCDDLEGWDGAGREVQERKDVFKHIVDSLHCMAKTNATW